MEMLQMNELQENELVTEFGVISFDDAKVSIDSSKESKLSLPFNVTKLEDKELSSAIVKAVEDGKFQEIKSQGAREIPRFMSNGLILPPNCEMLDEEEEYDLVSSAELLVDAIEKYDKTKNFLAKLWYKLMIPAYGQDVIDCLQDYA